MDVFDEWHHFLERAQREIITYFDHKSFQYFMITHVLNRCQFHLTIMFDFSPLHYFMKPFRGRHVN
jgi:hypothetical protein